MEFGERMELSEVVIDLAAILTDASHQSFSRPTKGSVLPPQVLFAGVALSPLQNPLEWIINDPLVSVELRYEAILRGALAPKG